MRGHLRLRWPWTASPLATARCTCQVAGNRSQCRTSVGSVSTLALRHGQHTIVQLQQQNTPDRVVYARFRDIAVLDGILQHVDGFGGGGDGVCAADDIVARLDRIEDDLVEGVV